MNYENLIVKINCRESVKLWAILAGKYDDYVKAYCDAAIPSLKQYWKNVIEPEVQHFCGAAWGTNPRLTTHPIGKALMSKNGYI